MSKLLRTQMTEASSHLLGLQGVAERLPNPHGQALSWLIENHSILIQKISALPKESVRADYAAASKLKTSSNFGRYYGHQVNDSGDEKFESTQDF